MQSSNKWGNVTILELLYTGLLAQPGGNLKEK